MSAIASDIGQSSIEVSPSSHLEGRSRYVAELTKRARVKQFA